MGDTSDEKPSKENSFQRNGLEALVIAGTTYGLYQLPPSFIDAYYSNSLFKPIAGIEGFVGDAIPVSIVEPFFIFAAASTLYCAGYSIFWGGRKIYELVKKRQLPSFKKIATNIRDFACRYARQVTIVALCATIAGALNFNRPSITDKLELTYQPTNADLTDLITRINEKRPSLSSVNFDKDVLTDTINQNIDAAYHTVNGTTIPGPHRIKNSLFPLRNYRIGGITMLSIESIVDCTTPDYFVLWAAGHEKAHTRGYLREADADSLNYLACLQSRNELLEYSALLHLFRLTTLYLAQENPTVLQRYEELNDLTKEDIKQVSLSFKSDTSGAAVAIAISDVQQKIRGSGNTFKAYVIETVPALWAIDKAYREGRLK